MARTFWVQDENAFRFLSSNEVVGLYDDNGGAPDGHLLPRETVSAEDAHGALQAGYGQMIDVLYANDDAMLHYCGIVSNEEDRGDETWELVRGVLNDEAVAWAHYGAYGAGDSSWVFTPWRRR